MNGQFIIKDQGYKIDRKQMERLGDREIRRYIEPFYVCRFKERGVWMGYIVKVRERFGTRDF